MSLKKLFIVFRPSAVRTHFFHIFKETDVISEVVYYAT